MLFPKPRRLIRWCLPGLAALALFVVGPASAANPASNPAAIPTPRLTLGWLMRFDSQNQLAQRPPVDLLYIGDSIVEHFENQGRDVWAHYYAPRHAINLGIGGDRTENVLWRLEHMGLGRISPKLAIVMIGQNNGPANSGEEIAGGIAAIVGVLRARLPATKILLLAIFPRGQKPNPERTVLAEANRIASRLADGRTVFYRDVDGLFLSPDGSIPKALMSDYEHPTPLGHRIWAEAIEPEVAELMGDRPIGPMR
jgi:beta-glucosidase